MLLPAQIWQLLTPQPPRGGRAVPYRCVAVVIIGAV